MLIGTIVVEAISCTRKMQNEAHMLSRTKGWWDECSFKVGGTRCGLDCKAHPPDREGTLDRQRVLAEVPKKNALIHSEISEAYTCLTLGEMLTTRDKNGKPVGFPTEIADVVIRSYDLAGALGLDIATAMADLAVLQPEDVDVAHVKSDLLNLHALTSFGLEAYRKHDMATFTQMLARLVRRCFALAASIENDLSSEILAKHEFNRTRPERHGGKAA